MKKKIKKYLSSKFVSYSSDLKKMKVRRVVQYTDGSYGTFEEVVDTSEVHDDEGFYGDEL